MKKVISEFKEFISRGQRHGYGRWYHYWMAHLRMLFPPW